MELNSEQATVRVDSNVSQETIEEEFDDVTVMDYVAVDDGGEVSYYTEEKREDLPDRYDWEDDKRKAYRIMVDGNEFLYMSECDELLPPIFVESSDYFARVSREENNMVIHSVDEDVYSAFDKVRHIFGDMEVLRKETCLTVEEALHNLDDRVMSAIDENTLGLTEDGFDIKIFIDSPYRLVVSPYDEVVDADEVMEEYEDYINSLVENDFLDEIEK